MAVAGNYNNLINFKYLYNNHVIVMKKEVMQKIEDAFSSCNDEQKIRAKLFAQGISRDEIDEYFSEKIKKKLGVGSKNTRQKIYEEEVYAKETIDRFVYGMTSRQYLFVLFNQLGGSVFLVAVLAALKSIFSVLGEFFMRTYQEFKGRAVMFKYSGVYLSLSFLGMAFSLLIESYVVMGVSIVLAFFFIMAYSESYKKSILLLFEEGKRTSVMAKVSFYGIFASILGMVTAAYIFDLDSFFGFNPLSFVFIAAALLMLVSSALSYAVYKDDKAGKEGSFVAELSRKYRSMKHDFNALMKNSTIKVFFLAGSLNSLVMAAGSAYYGVFIYKNLAGTSFGGFKNVALVFVIAALTSLFAPKLTRKNVFEYGRFPMLVFGTLLSAIMPLSYYYNPTIVSISMGTILGILGFTITGFSSGLLAVSVIPEQKKESYYTLSSIFAVIPYIVLMPIAGYIASSLGLQALFLGLAFVQVFIVMPLYLHIVLASGGKKI